MKFKVFERVRATEALKTAEDAEKEASELLKSVEKAAYEAGKKSAEREVHRLESEAENFYTSYVADMKLARVDTPQEKEVTKAVQAYVDAEEKVEATVESYNSLAISLANEVKMYAEKAKKLADQAAQEQGSGSSNLAAKHMLEAQKLMHMAKEKKLRALKVRGLAERLDNQVLPSYKQAVGMAKAHAMQF